MTWKIRACSIAAALAAAITLISQPMPGGARRAAA